MWPSANVRSRIPIDEAELRNWFDTGLCCLSIFYRHQTTGHIICDSCFDIEPAVEQRLYDGLIRHYIHLGSGELFEFCRNCYNVIPRTRTIRICMVCDDAAQDFLEYLRVSGDRPFDAAEPTVITISESDLRALPTSI